MYIGLYKIAIVRIFNYLMDQNACSSSHLICWMGEEEEVSAVSQRFWKEVYYIYYKNMI